MLFKSFRLFSAICAVCMVCGAGCGPAGSSPSVTSGAPPVSPFTALTPAPATASGCQQGYVPLQAGYEAEYQTDGSGVGRHALTDKVIRSDGHDADVEVLSDGRSLSHQHFICDDHGLVHALSYLDPSFLRMGPDVRMDPSTVSGDWLPADMQRTGAAADMDVRGGFTLQSPGMVRPVHIAFSLHMRRQVVGQESVTVPAGTYQAVKLDVLSNLSVNGAPTAPFHSTEWWVKNVGLVKQMLTDGGHTFTQQATNFIIP